MKKKIFNEIETKFCLHQFFSEITNFGGFVFHLVVLAFFLFYDFSYFKKILLGFIIIYLIILIVRLVYFKERPKKLGYSSLWQKVINGSFLSLHSARITFLFFVFLSFFKNLYLTGFLAFLTFLVAYSRIYLRRHYLIDVISGVVLGAVSYFLVFYFFYFF